MRKFLKFLLTLSAFSQLASCTHLNVVQTGDTTAEFTLRKGQTVLLPMQDRPSSSVFYVFDGEELVGRPAWMHLSIDTVGYYIPYKADTDVTIKITDIPAGSKFYEEVKLGRFKPINDPTLHFKPAYGWMNDPNGLFYKDGVWHLFYQYNRFDCKPCNCDWGHATSRDLLHWEHQPVAIERDTVGEAWSGSATVRGDSVVTIYTSCTRERQAQSVAVSRDGGYTFEKFADNPVITIPALADFRDPKILWYEPQQKWVVLVAHFDVVDIYSSPDLHDWTLESSFGRGIGGHQSCWECPDLFTMKDGDGTKWVLAVSCRRNNIVGQATQYFIGYFDGSAFYPDDTEERWFDDGRDNYAAITWSNAPDSRNVMVGWMGNWWYSADIPTSGWRGMMTTPRELTLGSYNGRRIVRSYPVREVLDNIDSDKVIYRKVTAADPDMEIYGLKLRFDFESSRFTIERKMDGFSVSELENRPEHELLVIKADGGVECFIDGGGVCMTVLSRLNPDTNK